MRQVVSACWTGEPDRRPSAAQVLDGLDIAEADYNKKKKNWPVGIGSGKK